MSAKSKQDLKDEFLSGSNITQAKLENLIDSSVNKVDDLSIDANGNVGIGTNDPKAKLEVNGIIKCIYLAETIDENLTEHLEPLEIGLKELLEYQPICFTWKDGNPNDKLNYGFRARDIQEIHENSAIVSDDGQNLSISYAQLIPVLTASIKELSIQIDQIKSGLD